MFLLSLKSFRTQFSLQTKSILDPCIVHLFVLLQEWRAFLHELHDAIQQQLTESHVKYFSDLSEAEKELFMQRATKAIDGGNTISVLFDENVLPLASEL